MYNLVELNKLVKVRRSQQSELLREHRFTPNEIDVLVCLAEDPAHNTASDISERRGISRSLVCRSVCSLAARGYITLKTDQTDHRYTHLSLNEKAQPVIRELSEEQSRLIQIFTKGIPEKELNIFEQVLAMMLKNARAE